MTPRRMLSEMTVHDLHEQMALDDMDREDELAEKYKHQSEEGLEKAKQRPRL